MKQAEEWEPSHIPPALQPHCLLLWNNTGFHSLFCCFVLFHLCSVSFQDETHMRDLLTPLSLTIRLRSTLLPLGESLLTEGSLFHKESRGHCCYCNRNSTELLLKLKTSSFLIWGDKKPPIHQTTGRIIRHFIGSHTAEEGGGASNSASQAGTFDKSSTATSKIAELLLICLS